VRRVLGAALVTVVALTAGCGSSPEAGPTRPSSTVDAATTAPSTPPSSTATVPSTRPSSTLDGSFSRVGGWIAYSGVDGIWAVDPVLGKRLIRVTRELGDPIAWSSDGSKLLIRRRSPDGSAGLSVLEADGTETRLTDGAGGDPTGGSFSPDGSEVVYGAGPWERSAIYAVRSDGGAPRLILRSTRRVSFPDGHSAPAFAYQPALSTDGTRIAYFDGMYDHSHNLWVANADGTERRVVLDDEVSAAGHIRALTWSPNGEWLAFTTDNSVYLVRPDGTGLRRIISGDFASAPAVQWSPDGSRLAYLRTGQTCGSPTGKDEDFTCEAGALSILNLYSGYEQVIRGIRTPLNAVIAWNHRM
jgi:Tol biopolymer transport system component